MSPTSPNTEPRFSRRSELWIIGSLTAIASLGVWLIGFYQGSAIVKYFGFIIGASTFVPMPADAYVIASAASQTMDPLTMGIVGGIVNGLVVLVEARWFRTLSTTPGFDKFNKFVGTNKWVDQAEEAMFMAIVIGALSFLPFEPFRLVAATRRYNQFKYFLATAIGRGVRYYWLARVGALFNNLGSLNYIIWGAIALFVLGLIRSYRRFNENQ